MKKYIIRLLSNSRNVVLEWALPAENLIFPAPGSYAANKIAEEIMVPLHSRYYACPMIKPTHMLSANNIKTFRLGEQDYRVEELGEY